ncbi:MAG: B12-binding domain-containing radical SAM protein, partial [Atopobiaceae bacterium]|nr:B12-binding domain-containing radical SAM protein [Atopobiaceae bacterium]
MRLAREDLFYRIEPLLALVERPSRYINHEWGAHRGNEDDFHVCLIYPDTYEVGMSNLGVAILYN